MRRDFGCQVYGNIRMSLDVKEQIIVGLAIGIVVMVVEILLARFLKKASYLPIIFILAGVFICGFSFGWMSLIGYGIAAVIGITISIILEMKKTEKLKEQQSQEDETRKNELKFITECWQYGHSIDSRDAKLCYKCGKHYRCPYCGACECERPGYREEKNYYNDNQ